MRTPITYYGGKLSLISKILPLIPKHHTYIEPFFGGGALYFAKEKSPSEIINDTSDFVINFYKVLKTNFEELKIKVDSTLYSRVTYKVCLVMYRMPHLFNDLQKAWAFWILTSQGFSGIIGSWSYDKDSAKAKTSNNKKLRFTKDLAKRLETTQIENTDALKVITSRDTINTFNFIDPPYINADQGHYSGYAEEEYINLLNALTNIKGKFLLTTYHSEILNEYVKKNGWHQIEIEKPLTAYKSKGGKRKRKIEVFTMNYKIKTNSELS